MIGSLLSHSCKPAPRQHLAGTFEVGVVGNPGEAYPAPPRSAHRDPDRRPLLQGCVHRPGLNLNDQAECAVRPANDDATGVWARRAGGGGHGCG